MTVADPIVVAVGIRGMDATFEVEDLELRHVEMADAAIESDASVYVVGPLIQNPAALAARLHAHRPHVEILVLADPGGIDNLRRQMQLTPGLGECVRCLEIDGSGLATPLRLAAQRASRRRGHAATLETIHQAGIPARQSAGPLVNYLEQLMELIPVGVLGIDGAGHIATWNRAAHQILAIATEQLQGASLANLFNADRLADIDAVLLGDAVGPSTVQLQMGSVAEPRHVELVAARVTAPNGQPGGLVLVRDVTAEVAERQAQQELDRLRVLMESAGAAAHEINNPLTGLMGSLELLLSSDSEAERREMADLALSEAARIRDVVARMAKIREYATRSYLDTRIIDLRRAAPDESVG